MVIVCELMDSCWFCDLRPSPLNFALLRMMFMRQMPHSLHPICPRLCSCGHEPMVRPTSALHRLRLCSLRNTAPFSSFRDHYAIRPRIELIVVLAMVLFCSLLWSTGLEILSVAELIALVPMMLILQFSPSSHSGFIFYMTLAGVAIAGSVDPEHGIYTVAMLRVMLIMSPSIFLPFLQSTALVALVFVGGNIGRAIVLHKHHHYDASQGWSATHFYAGEETVMAQVFSW